MLTLRQRIRGHKINCMPWKRYRYEIQRLPISAQCLFARGGIPADVLEMELLEEGWLLPGEELLDVLQDGRNLKRERLSALDYEDDFTKGWTDQDFINYFGKEGN
jgi:hypothetical protein